MVVAALGVLFFAQAATSLMSSAGLPATIEANANQESVRLRVLDGDTVEVRGTGERVRLANIDTPETKERAECSAEREAGDAATREARRLVSAAQAITISRTGREDQYGRTIGYVRLDGRDLGERLISSGYARPWRGQRESWCAADGTLRR